MSLRARQPDALDSKTLRGRALLGWMQKSDAVRFLQQDCRFEPPLDASQAEALWRSYRVRVEALPHRAYSAQATRGLNSSELGHQARFFAFLNAGGPHDVSALRRVDVRELVVCQHHLVVERAKDYAARLKTERDWLLTCIPTSRSKSQVEVRTTQTGMNTYSEIDLPHGEFCFSPNVSTGAFSANELMHHVTVIDGADRTFLWSGYHRLFAKASSTSHDEVATAVVAVIKNALVRPPSTSVAGDVAESADPLDPSGTKAAKFGDFFTEGLFVDVDLKKKRYQLQVIANRVAIDAS